MNNRVEELRKANNMSMQELADQVGITYDLLSDIEIDKQTPSLTVAYKLARAFGHFVEYVFNLEQGYLIEKMMSDDGLY